MTSRAQRQVVIGLQASAGTGVVPDFALHGMLDIKANVDKIKPDEDIGSFAPSRHYIGSIMPEGTLKNDAMVYEEFPHYVAMAMGTETPSGGGSPYTWAWALPDTTPNDFVLYSVEYTDGGTWVTRAIDVFGTGLTISGEAGQAWKVEVPLTGGEITYPTALTGTPSALGTNSTVRMADTLCYMDDSWAGIGVTEMAELISFSWKLESLQHSKLFAGSLYPSGRGNDKWGVTLEVIAEVENAVIAVERALHLNTTLSAIRIKATSGAFSATIDGMYFLQDAATLDQRDGNNTIKLTYTGQKDGSDNTGNITILSSLAAL